MRPPVPARARGCERRRGRRRLRALDRVLVLVDTSASRAPVMGRQVELVRGLVAALPADAVGLDRRVRSQRRRDLSRPGGAGGGGGDRVVRARCARRPRTSERRSGVRQPRGHDASCSSATASRRWASTTRRGSRRSSAARRSRGSTRSRVGRSLDRATLAALAAAGREPGAILDGRDPAHAARQLAAALPRELPIRVDGAMASFPATTRGLAPGEPIWVAGRRFWRRPAGGADRGARDRADAEAGGSRPRAAGGRPRRDRRADGAAAANAAARGRESIGARIEALALIHHLVSARTSLLVLEVGRRRAQHVDGRGAARRGTGGEARRNSSRIARQRLGWRRSRYRAPVVRGGGGGGPARHMEAAGGQVVRRRVAAERGAATAAIRRRRCGLRRCRPERR